MYWFICLAGSPSAWHSGIPCNNAMQEFLRGVLAFLRGVLECHAGMPDGVLAWRSGVLAVAFSSVALITTKGFYWILILFVLVLIVSMTVVVLRVSLIGIELGFILVKLLCLGNFMSLMFALCVLITSLMLLQTHWWHTQCTVCTCTQPPHCPVCSPLRTRGFTCMPPILWCLPTKTTYSTPVWCSHSQLR